MLLADDGVEVVVVVVGAVDGEAGAHVMGKRSDASDRDRVVIGVTVVETRTYIVFGGV